MTERFILDERGRAIPCPDLFKWAEWIEKGENRVVKKEFVGKTEISTVFLGLNHRYGPGTPILWETMCFGRRFNGTMDRCAGNREQAEAMHERMVARVKGANSSPAPPATPAE